MNETRELAKFLAELSFQDLPQNAIEMAKDLTLDQFGVQLAASTKPWSQAVYKYVRDQGERKESTIINYGDKTSVVNAAYANATFGHGFELDDTHRQSMSHPSCLAVASALALGESKLCSGKDYLTAVVAAYEAIGRIGRCAGPTYGFHHTSVVGPFGVATLAGKLLDFDRNRMLHALSIAGSHASGLSLHTEGGGTAKRMNAGIAAYGGLRAAFLAERGLTAPPTILEGEHGFCRAFSQNPRLELILANLGSEYMITQTAYKRHACDYFLQAPLDLLSQMAREHKIKPQDVEEIVLGAMKASFRVIGATPEPQDIMGCHYSAHFSLAMNLVKGSNSFHDYDEENLWDPEIRSLARKARLVPDEELERAFPARRGARITIRLKDGTTYTSMVRDAKGTPENPMSKKELHGKFLELATIALPREKAERIIDVVEGLEGMEDVSGLAALLAR